MATGTHVISIDTKKPRKAAARRYVRSLEYRMLASLAMQQFLVNDAIVFEKLLSLPLGGRIQALCKEHGNRRVYKMIRLLLQEFCAAVPLPRTKKPTETRIAVCTCDLMIAAQEDQLALEDLLIFFETTLSGRYGEFGKLLTHHLIMQKLDTYRKERAAVYQKIKDEKEVYLKGCGPVQRLANEPTQIGQLMKEAAVVDMNKRKSS